MYTIWGTHQLKSCYTRSLELAKEYEISSIAFPAISCGVYGFPIKDACKIAYNTVSEFLQNNKSIEQVIFIDINDEVIETYKELIG